MNSMRSAMPCSPLRPSTWNPNQPWVSSAVGLGKCLPTHNWLAASHFSLALPCPKSESQESRSTFPSPCLPGGHRDVPSLLTGSHLPPPTSTLPPRGLRKVSEIPWFLLQEGQQKIQGRPFLALPKTTTCRLSFLAHLNARIQ